jgi:carbon monoxide dehydrogenase subunit G
MNLKGERIIPASVERTWTALNDPETLKACIAGCESIEPTGEDQYLAVMAVRIGPVNAKFKGRLQLSDIVPLQSYKINFDGQGGVAGFGKGSANVALSPEGESGQSTRLNYVADAQVGGKIAQVGSRLVESAAAKIADDFFKAFEARMTASNDAAPAAAGPDAAAPADGAFATAPAVATDAAPPRPAPTLDHVAGREAPVQAAGGGGGSTIWWIAGIIVLALLVYFFTR